MEKKCAAVIQSRFRAYRANKQMAKLEEVLRLLGASCTMTSELHDMVRESVRHGVAAAQPN
eukprot:7019118-Lingulodinium_polyedra.AAC.1